MEETIGYKKLIHCTLGDEVNYISPSRPTIWRWPDASHDGYWLEEWLELTPDGHSGIYTLKSETDPQMQHYTGTVFKLQLYGTIVEGTTGYRSSGAMIIGEVPDTKPTELDKVYSGNTTALQTLANHCKQTGDREGFDKWNELFTKQNAILAAYTLTIPMIQQGVSNEYAKAAQVHRESLACLFPMMYSSGNGQDIAIQTKSGMMKVLKELQYRYGRRMDDVASLLALTDYLCHNQSRRLLTYYFSTGVLNALIEYGSMYKALNYCIRHQYHDARVALWLGHQTRYARQGLTQWCLLWPNDAEWLFKARVSARKLITTLLKQEHDLPAEQKICSKWLHLVDAFTLHRINAASEYLNSLGFHTYVSSNRFTYIMLNDGILD